MATFFLILIYFAFISLGLPDSLLGVSWPVMQPGFQVPFSFAGIASMVISGGTIVSSLLSGRVIHRFGTGKVTFISVMMTAFALLGFSLAPSFTWIILLAVPLGLGAGAVDSGLNGYVAEHYKARHMSWLHCFWGIGALSGPLIMAQLIANDLSWRSGYLIVSIIQFGLVAVLFFSLPLWSKASPAAGDAPAHPGAEAPVTRGVFFPLKIHGVKTVLLAFLFYCGIETTVGLWGSSYLVRARGLDAATAAAWVSTYYGSITVGRLIAGFITMKIHNTILIRIGQVLILAGGILLFLPLPAIFALVGFTCIGLGCAPIFPGMLHETPVRFGKADAQLVMGFQMAAAYIGSTFLPPVFGFIASNTSLALLPVFVLVYCAIMLGSSERLNTMLKVRRAQAPGLASD
ncbi:MAG: MFS transporter [Anaerolineales bacterium]|jgi:fucose permease|nr:MFS transporter [Anaerolineales bacterium]